MTRFWETGSFEQELMDGMEKAQLIAVASDENRDDSRIVEAMEELNAAAESFELAGRVARAKEVTSVMVSLAEGKKKKQSKKNTSSEDAKKMFMFFGFKPEDLKGLNLSSDGDGDEE